MDPPPASRPPPVSTRRALAEAAAVWLAAMATFLGASLATGVWGLSDLWTTPWAAEGGFLVTAVLGTALVVGAPVALYRRLGLVVPLVALVGYFGYWTYVAAVTTGDPARGPFYAFLYGFLFLVAVPVLAGVEYVLRRGLARPLSPT